VVESHGIFNPPRPAYRQSLRPLPVPSAGVLTAGFDWSHENAKRLRLAGNFLAQNDELIGMLETLLQRADFNRYNLMVFFSIARLCRQNQNMLMGTGMGGINGSLRSAREAAPLAMPQGQSRPRRGVGQRLKIRQERKRVL
jgi:hypothetical protein